jgi:hypothetical protein
MIGVGAFGAVSACLCLAVMFIEYRRTGEIISPLIIFLGLAIFDIYLPAISFGLVGPPILAPWLDHEAVVSAMPAALVIFTAAFGLFALGYTVAHVVPRAERSSPAPSTTLRRSQVIAATAALVVAVAWYGWTIAYRAAASGGLASYVMSRLVLRWQAEPMTNQYPTASSAAVLALQIGDVLIPVITLTILVLVAASAMHPIARFAFPMIGLLIAFTTFFRGTLLSYFTSLGAMSEIRSSLGSRGLVRHVPALALIAVGVVLFLGYGVIRNTAVLAAQHEAEVASGVVRSTPTPIVGIPGIPGVVPGATSAPSESGRPTDSAGVVPVVTQEAVSYEAGRVLRGEGLIGLSSIIAYFPGRQPYLGGKTIGDMLLLPIPRSIWREKPPWYGIAEVTRAMGEPTSTQSAVTIPGELYANFGPAGVLGTFGFGLLFGYVHRLRHGVRFRYLYAAVLLPLMFVTFWMATTGLVNGLLPLAPALLVVLLIFPPSGLRLDWLRATRPRFRSV